MTDDTKNCDDVVEYLEGNYADLKDAVLYIHTRNNGEISEAATGKSKEDLDQLRRWANEIDAQDNIYVADYGNRRIQVFDAQGNFRRAMSGFGAPMAICITPRPNQVMYVSNSNPPDNLDVGGEIYKMELNGTIIGRFGTAGKMIGQFGTVNAIDCREENDLLVGELGNWRVQRVTLQPM